MDLDVFKDGSLQLASAAVHTAPNLFFGQPCEPSFHQIDPRSSCRREVQMETRMLGPPAPNPRGLVCAVVIQDQVRLESSGHRCVDLVQELAEFDGPMAPLPLPQHSTALDVEGSEQRSG